MSVFANTYLLTTRHLRPYFQLGYYARLVSYCWYSQLARLPFLVFWLRLLDAGIRYDLRASGEQIWCRVNVKGSAEHLMSMSRINMMMFKLASDQQHCYSAKIHGLLSVL